MRTRELQFPTDRIGTSRRRRSPRHDPPTENEPTGRGTWSTEFPVRGCECLLAVTADGEQIARVPIPEDANRDEIITLLEQLLDSVDPATAASRLELVR